MIFKDIVISKINALMEGMQSRRTCRPGRQPAYFATCCLFSKGWVGYRDGTLGLASCGRIRACLATLVDVDPSLSRIVP
jgi:hypothetical protein